MFHKIKNQITVSNTVQLRVNQFTAQARIHTQSRSGGGLFECVAADELAQLLASWL